MATFVVVHPAWFGGWCWGKVAPLLRAQGHEVHTPTLTGLGERDHLASPGVGLGTHIADVVNVLVFENLEQVILVGTSSSGFVIGGVADRVPERIALLVYLDAFVPENGQSLWSLFPPDRQAEREELVRTEGDGWLLPRFATPPWEQFVRDSWAVTDDADLRWVLPRLRPTPLGHFTEPLELKRSEDEPPRRVFVRCQWPNPAFDRHAEHARVSANWNHCELAASHIAYVSDPDVVAALLLDLAAPVSGRRGGETSPEPAGSGAL